MTRSIFDIVNDLKRKSEEEHVGKALERIANGEMARMEAHWTKDDISVACEMIADDLEGSVESDGAIDEAVEVLRVMAMRERRFQSLLQAVEPVLNIPPDVDPFEAQRRHIHLYEVYSIVKG